MESRRFICISAILAALGCQAPAGQLDSAQGETAQASDDSSSAGESSSDSSSTSNDSSDSLGETTAATDTTTESSEGESESESESETETGGVEPEVDWQVVHQADGSQGALMSVWGSSPAEVFAVGGQLQPNVGTVLRFDGDAWLPEDLPPATPMLDWVFGTGDRVWAVGRAGVIVVREAGLWSAEPSPTSTILWGLWGASEDELWAVGGDGNANDPVLLRRDGDTELWSEVAIPELGVSSHGLFKVWGTSASDVWVVGDRGATLHFDGSEWTAHPAAVAIDLISLWGSPSEGIIAAGGRASGHLSRLDGQSWIGQTLALPGLNGIWVDEAGPVTAVGVGGTIVSVTPGSFEVVEENSPTPLVLHAVFGFSGGPRFAVGGSLLAPPPYIGVILESPM